jgi:hypothetical protein
MTHDQFIAALANDQETTKTKIEDFLLALRDICADALETDGRVTAGPLGVLYLTQHRAVGFRASDQVRKRLNAADVKLPALFERATCGKCKSRAVKVRYVQQKKCPTCIETARVKNRAKKNATQAA